MLIYYELKKKEGEEKGKISTKSDYVQCVNVPYFKPLKH